MAQRVSIAQAQLEAAKQFLSERVRRQPPDEESLQLADVIEEEYACLDGVAAEPPLRHDWSVQPQHIVDVADFARKLHAAVSRTNSDSGTRSTAAADATRDISKALLGAQGAGGEGLRAAFQAYAHTEQPGVELANRLAEQIAGRMNELLDEADLCFYPGFATLQLDAHGEDLRLTQLTTVGGRHRELNRLLFEAAYPSQLAKDRDLRLAALYADARTHDHAALCISGGGIRSATFALGVLQGLARLGLLNRFRYLSTVSGGGYVGSWLSAWMMRSGPTHVASALSHPPREKLQPDPEPIQYLRAFSNFLSPSFGALTADTWTLLATYLRNLWINWLVSLPLLAAVVLVPYVARAVVDSEPWHWGPYGRLFPSSLAVLGALCAAQCVRFVHASRPQSDAFRPKKREGREEAVVTRPSQAQFLVRCLAPLVLGTMMLTTSWQLFRKWSLVHDDTPDAGLLGLSGVPFVGRHFALTAFVVVGALIHLVGWAAARRRSRHPLREFLAIILTGALAASAAHLAADFMGVPAGVGDRDDAYVVLAMPVFLLVMLFGSQFFLAWMSARTQDPEREWGARFNAWVLIVAVSWMVFSALVLFGPPLLLTGHAPSRAAKLFLTVVGGWSGITTILLGWGVKTSGGGAPATPSKVDRLRTIALAVAAPLFAATIVVLISGLDEQLIRGACDVWPKACDPLYHGHSAPWIPVGIGVALAVIGVAFGRRIDTNKFSLHAMYRARLIRAYLGASRPGGERDPDPFTGFDEFDNLRMQDLWPAAMPADDRVAATGSPPPPLHLINAALNLVGGRNLAWQERKAESFTISSLHAGSPFTGYRRTSPARTRIDHSIATSLPSVASARHDKPRLYGDDRGVSLGTAMTISGAAANPSMGYHSSPAVTFLLTLFNARLGWWLGNPGPAGRKTFDRAAPRLTAGLIVRELFGLTNDRAPYVQLSDGGHFDNLGLYEIVLRRCRQIVVVDSTGDAECGFDDLGNSIRKIRIDLGVPIEFEGPMQIHKRGAQRRPDDMAGYWAVARVRYSCVDAAPNAGPAEGAAHDGTLIYVKPAYYGTEPRDVCTYANEHQTFPHEATSDQFYTESQFESYRALGSYVMELLEPRAGEPHEDPSFERLAARVRARAGQEVK